MQLLKDAYNQYIGETMRCPQYIKDLCIRRAKAATKFMDYDYEIAEWLEKHNIEVEDFDIHTGCESICNPYPSSYRIIKAIENGGTTDEDNY